MTRQGGGRGAAARLLAAEGVSALGDAMATTALVLHLLPGHGTPGAVALLLAAQAVAPLLSPLAGAAVDRWPPTAALAGSLAASAALEAALAWRLPGLVGLLAAVALLSLAALPAAAAVGAALPSVVDDERLPGADAARSGLHQLGVVVGPPLAGLLVAWRGVGTVLAVDAATSLLAVPLVLGLPRRTAAREPSSLRTDAGEGLRHLVRATDVLALAAGFWIVVLLSAPDDLVLPFLARTTFGAGPLGIGVLLAGASTGLLVGLPLVGPLGRRLGLVAAVGGGFAVVAVGNLLTAVAPWLAAAFAAQALRGLALPLIDATIATRLQRATPPALLGRTLANVYGGVSIAAAAGYLLGGRVLAASSPRTTFAAIGTAGLATAAVAVSLLHRTTGAGDGTAPQVGPSAAEEAS